MSGVVKHVQRAHSGQWFVGFREALIGMFAVSLCTFLAACAALRRREKGGVAAVIPLLAGGLGSLYFGGLLIGGIFALLRHR